MILYLVLRNGCPAVSFRGLASGVDRPDSTSSGRKSSEEPVA